MALCLHLPSWPSWPLSPGWPVGALTSYLVRHFAEILLSIAVFYVVVNSVHDAERLGRLVRWLIRAAVASVLGIILYVVPETFAIQALSALGRFGYPTGQGVIWHIRDDPELMKRATATSVHPMFWAVC